MSKSATEQKATIFAGTLADAIEKAWRLGWGRSGWRYIDSLDKLRGTEGPYRNGKWDQRVIISADLPVADVRAMGWIE